MATTLKDRLPDPSSSFVNNTTRSPVVNAFVGGQNGPTLNIGRYVNNAAYISRPLIARVVTFPRWVDYMPDPKVFRTAIKTFFEVQTKIDGLQKGLQAEFNEQEIGAAGHRQFDLTKVTMTMSDITHDAGQIRLAVSEPVQYLVALRYDGPRVYGTTDYCVE